MNKTTPVGSPKKQSGTLSFLGESLGIYWDSFMYFVCGLGLFLIVIKESIFGTNDEA